MRVIPGREGDIETVVITPEGETEVWREGGESALEEDPRLEVNGEALDARLGDAGLSFPVGPLPSGGLLDGGRFRAWRR
jgi:hypothetical protein